MKKYVYAVKGLNTDSDAEKIISAISSEILGVKATACIDAGTVTLEIDTRITNINDVQAYLIPLLQNIGYELICPPNVQKYAYCGENGNKVKQVPVSVMVTAIAITAVVCILFTYIFASGIFSFKNNIFQGSSDNKPLDISDSLDRVEKLNEILSKIQYNYSDLTNEKVTEYLLDAYMAATGDKYAQYMNAEEYAAFINSNSGSSAGMGITITGKQIEIDGVMREVIYINEVAINSPANKCGILAGDCIVSIKYDGKDQLVYEVGYSTAKDMLIGDEGTSAEFTVLREENGEYKKIDFTVKREKYENQSVIGKISETNSNIGIVKITEFDLKTPKQFKEEISKLQNEGCEYFVFDLRNNPGGDLLSISAVLSYFLNEGDVIISTEDSQGNTTVDRVATVTYKDSKADCSVTKEDIGRYKDLKFAVLVNENTASAAELFTATVKDYELGTVVGTKTYGKGCMQQILPLATYGIPGAIRVTTKMYFSKSHTIYHDIGITPHEYEELSEEAKKYNISSIPQDIDNQLQKAISLLINK